MSLPKTWYFETAFLFAYIIFNERLQLFKASSYIIVSISHIDHTLLRIDMD